MATNAITNWAVQEAIELLGGQALNWPTDTIKLAILTAVPDIETVASYADVLSTEASGTAYTAGGKALSGKSVVKDQNSGQYAVDVEAVVKLLGDPVTWLSSSITGRAMVIYKVGNSNANSPVLGVIDLLQTQQTENSTWSVTPPATGYLQVTVKKQS